MSHFSPVAIVSTACRLPKGDGIDEFWSMVLRGETAIAPAPEERFNRSLFYDPEPGKLNKTYTDLAALINYRPVNKQICPLPEGAEEDFDVAHLTFAESVASACRSAGYDPADFPCKNTGLFVGHTRPGAISQQWIYQYCLPETVNYLNEVNSFTKNFQEARKEDFFNELKFKVSENLQRLPRRDRPNYLSSDIGFLVSKMLKINGPYMVFNSACASSLHAISQAIFALQHHRIDMAFAGGATFFHSDTLLLFASSRSMTKKRSCPFDRDADGLVVGEGNVVFLLKRLEDALRDGDSVLAVFTGAGIASDGKGKSLWAPRKEGQIEAIERAYSDDVKMDDIDYIEAHATSTALGDATELSALNESFGQKLNGRKIPLGSAKGNIGHTLEVAGAAGVLKAVLALKNATVPPVAGLRNLNPNIPWDEVPFYAPMQKGAFAKPNTDRPRRAAVNSFGIGGLNVHLVLDEYIEDYWKDKVKSSAKNSVSYSGMNTKEINNQAGSIAKNENIAIVGTGCILPGAYSTAAFYELLESGKAVFKHVPKKIWDLELFREKFMSRYETVIPDFMAGVIDKYSYDWKKNKVPPKQVENASPIQFMMLDAVNEALASFNRPAESYRNRTGVVVGTSFGGDFANKMNCVLQLPDFQVHLKDLLLKYGFSEKDAESVSLEYSKLLHKKMPALLDETGSFTPSALASRITKTLDLAGGAVAVESAGGSFGASLLCCIDQLQAGVNDMMVCIGGNQDLGPSIYDLFFNREILSKNPEVFPLDSKADGYATGEGCGVLLLKRLEDAQKDGDKILAVVSKITANAGIDIYDNFKSALERTGINSADQIPADLEAEFQGIPRFDSAVIDALVDWRNDIKNDEKLTDLPKTSLGTTVSQIGCFDAGTALANCLKSIYELQKQKLINAPRFDSPAFWLERNNGDVFVQNGSKNIKNTSPEKIGVLTGVNCMYYIQLEKY